MADLYLPDDDWRQSQSLDFKQRSRPLVDAIKRQADDAAGGLDAQASTAVAEPPQAAPAAPQPAFTLPPLETYTAPWNAAKPAEMPQGQSQSQDDSKPSLPPLESYTSQWQQPSTITPNDTAGPTQAPPSSIAPNTAPAASQTAPQPVQTTDRQSFINSALPYAQEAERKYGIPASFTLALAVNEHGGEARYMPGEHNYFGIQASDGQDGTPYKDWRPGPNGEQVFYETKARNFGSDQEAFDTFAQTIASNPRYAGALQQYRQTGDLGAFVKGVQAGGYAEDPQWSTKVLALAREMPTSGSVAAPPPPTAPGTAPVAMPSGDLTPNQFGGGLSDAEAYAACGPAAAIAFARREGRNPTMQEAVGLARQVGWTPENGMAGPSSQVELLQRMGIASKLEQGVDWSKVAADVQAGNPVTISTPGHYFVAERYDPNSGKFDFGNSAVALKASGGQRWFSPDEIARLGMGAPTASIFLDDPSSPSPSTVAGGVGAGPSAAGAVSDAAGPPPQAESPHPVAQQLSSIGQGISDGFKKLGELLSGGSQAASGALNNASAGLSGALNDAAPQALEAASQIPSPPNITRTVGGAIEGAVGAGAQAVGSVLDSGPARFGLSLLGASPEQIAERDARMSRLSDLTDQIFFARDSGAPQDPAVLDEWTRLTTEAGPDFQQGGTEFGKQLADKIVHAAPPVLEAMSRRGFTPDVTRLEMGVQAAKDALGNAAQSVRDAAGDFGRGLGQPLDAPAVGLEARPTGGLFGRPIERSPAAPAPTDYAATGRLIENTNLGDALASEVEAKLTQTDGPQVAQRFRDWMRTLKGEGEGTGTDPATYRDVRQALADTLRTDEAGVDAFLKNDLGYDGVVQRGRGADGQRTAEVVPFRGEQVVDMGQSLQSQVMQARNARGASNLRAVAPDEPFQGPSIGLEARQVGQAADSQRFYHGTGSAFDTTDASKFDPNGLFGPGYYLTDDPAIASDYARNRGELSGGGAKADLKRIQDEIALTQSEIANPDYPQALRDHLRDEILPQLQERAAQADRVLTTGPNVRPVDVPRGLNLLDGDQPLSPVEQRAISDAAVRAGQPALGEFVKDLPNDRGWWEALWSRTRAQDHSAGTSGRLNSILADAGYDGILHSGGGRMPMPDAAGNPIDHQAVMIFGDSLPKIRNAISLTPGGINASPGTVAGNAAVRAATGATAGAASTYYSPPTDENGQPLEPGSPGYNAEFAKRAALGAAAGLAGGRLKAAPGLIVKATNLSDPRNVQSGQMFEKVPKAPSSNIPLSQRLVQALTDDQALIYAWQKDLNARNKGNPAVPQDLIGDLNRFNPDSAATQRLEPMEQAGKTLKDAGVDSSVLSVYLARVHDIDIANEFGQRAYDAAITAGRTPAQAQAAAVKAANGRTFSGGMHLQDLVQSVQSMQNDLTPAQNQAVSDAANVVWKINQETLKRKFDVGGLTAAEYQELSQRYPHYVTTDIINHLDPEGMLGGAGGSSGSLSQTRAPIQKLSAAGTAADRLDPLASVVANTVRSERWIAQNAKFKTFYDAVQVDPQSAAEILGVRTAGQPQRPGVKALVGKGEKEVTGYYNGERKSLVMTPQLADLLGLGDKSAGGNPNMVLALLGHVMNAFKSGITTYNPSFQYGVNPVRDAGDFLIRQSAYEGGPQMLPKVMQAYAQAIPDVLSGFWKGQYTGPATQRYRLAGGSYERLGNLSPERAQNAAADLMQGGGIRLDSPAKVASFARDVLTLGAKPVGERIEMFPRVAAFKLAEQGIPSTITQTSVTPHGNTITLSKQGRRPASQLEAMIAGHNATVPFEVGGTVSRDANKIIPFFNPTIQAAAQLGRTFRDHPVAATASVATVLGTSALAAQFYNRSDPDRAAAFQDVPQYLKDTGVVWMMPWAGSDNRGPLKNYVWIPVGTFAPAVMAANEAVAHAAGDAQPRDMLEMFTAMTTMFSPIKGQDVGSAVSSVLPPGLSEAVELGNNRDFYRGRAIATDAADRNASTLAQGTTDALHGLGDSGLPLTGNMRDIRPSQVDYLMRNLGGIAGQIARAGSDMVVGREDQRDRPVQDFPILGGIAGRIVRDQGGQQLENASRPDNRLPPAVESVIRDAGMHPNDVVQPVGVVAKGVPLDRDQQLQWQELTNSYLEREMLQAQRSADYRNPATREQAVRDAVTRAKNAAADRILSRIPQSQQQRLIREEAARKAS